MAVLMGYTKNSRGLSFLAVMTNPKELECLYYFQEWGDSALICVECIVILSWTKFPCALEMCNTAVTREPHVDSDEALKKQSSV